ncbi:MAG: response regulator [Oscillospiraceae bacterium]|jgi:PAS domain S-box-containing protein|nr:response regulator [Oscillospiraceae bacterium]
MDNGEREQALLSEIKALQKENKRLQRELERQKNINHRSKISAESNANLSRIVSFEKSRLEQYMNLLLGNCPDIILLFDREGKIVYASESYLKRSKTSALSLIRGKTFRELLSPVTEVSFLSQIDAFFQSALTNRQQYEVEYDIDFEQDGHLRHYIIQLTPMLDGGKAVEGAIAMLCDTTELIRVRDEAQAARKLAEQSTRAKSDFLSRMSHEMRTPLNAIIGMTGIAQKSNDINYINYAISKVNEASQHLLGVINDVLDISKIEAEKFELYYEDFYFEKMLQSVVNVNSFRVEEKKQNFKVYIDPNIPPVLHGDKQRLSQVVTNLLSNATKFTDEYGSLRLNVFLENVEDDIYTIHVEVIDSGIGISDDQKERIFVKFEQADGSISRRFGGTGLGLVISKRIIEMMGGQIWVESKPGKGSTFAFRVPMKKGERADDSAMVHRERWSNLRILAVDDMEDVREYFVDVVKKNFSINCDVASSGSEALDLLSKHGMYDIYFVDWKMPEMDGITLARKIRELDPSGHAIVIMISSISWDVIAKEAKEAGVDYFLPKPLFPSSIADCINECLGNRNIELISGADDSENYEGRHILLAEDIEINREIVMNILEPTKIGIDCAENGQQAADMFAASPEKYDLIFMDIQMPLVDGYEATRIIRSSGAKNAKTIPIIAMTANVFREDIEKCLEAGMNEHIGKPIDIDELFARLNKYLY